MFAASALPILLSTLLPYSVEQHRDDIVTALHCLKFKDPYSFQTGFKKQNEEVDIIMKEISNLAEISTPTQFFSKAVSFAIESVWLEGTLLQRVHSSKKRAFVTKIKEAREKSNKALQSLSQEDQISKERTKPKDQP